MVALVPILSPFVIHTPLPPASNNHNLKPLTITTSNPLSSPPIASDTDFGRPNEPLAPASRRSLLGLRRSLLGTQTAYSGALHAPHPLAAAPVLKLLTFALRVPLAEKSQRSRRLLAATGEDSSALSASASADEQINANDNAASSGDDAQTQEQGTDSAGDTNEYA